MKAREYDEKRDYAMICGWWEDWEWEQVPTASLPEHGVVVESDGKPIYAGFIYKTDSNICLFEFIISDKMAGRELKAGGLDFLIQAGKKKAKELGFDVIMSWIKEPNLMRAFKKHEIFPTDPDITTFVGVL